MGGWGVGRLFVNNLSLLLSMDRNPLFVKSSEENLACD